MLIDKLILLIIGGFIFLVIFVFIIACLVVSTEIETYDEHDKK